MKKRINESRLSNIVRRNIRMVMNESHGEPEQYPCVLIDDILEDYKAEEIAEEDGLESADKAALRYFSETMYESGENEAMMPKYSEYVASIDEEHDLYRDYGAGYYFVVVKRMAEGKKRPTANRLNESIRRAVRRYVNEAVNELDPRTYASYADKRAAQGQTEKAKQGKQAAVDAWNRKYKDVRYDERHREMFPDYDVEDNTHTQHGNGEFDVDVVNYKPSVRPDFMLKCGHKFRIAKSGMPVYKDTYYDDKVPFNQQNAPEHMKVAHQMATGTGNYIKGKGWQ